MGTAMYGDEFADAVAVAKARLGALAFVLHVLRSHPHRAVRVEEVIFADPCGAFQVDVCHQPRARPDLHLRANNTIRSDIGVLRDPRLGVYDSGRMDRHGSDRGQTITSAGCWTSLSASLHIISASATS